MAVDVHVVVEYAASSDTRERKIRSIVGVVHEAQEAAQLRAEARLVGVSLEAAGGHSRNDHHGDVPAVRLSMEELVVGVTHGFVRLVRNAESGELLESLNEALKQLAGPPTCGNSSAFDLDDLAVLRVRVFADLWSRGHFVALGSKFGVDFLLYNADPSTGHSFAMVHVKMHDATFSTVDIVSHCRVAKMVKKAFFLASMHDGNIVYCSLDHAVLAPAGHSRGECVDLFRQ